MKDNGVGALMYVAIKDTISVKTWSFFIESE